MDTAPDRSPIRVRCEELAPVIGDLAGNLRKIGECVQRAALDGVDLLVLPELATSGYSFADRDEARRSALAAGGDELAQLAQLVPSWMTVVVGFCESAGPTVFNSAAAIGGGRVLAVYRKTHLWNTEKRIFVPGDSAPPVVRTPFGRLGVLVCYDLEFPEMPRALALAGADIIAAPVNWPLLERPAGEHAPEVIQAMAAARSSRIAIACCDRCGDERGTRWTRGTSIIDSEGWIAAAVDPVHEGASFVEAMVDVSVDRGISPLNHAVRDRRPSLYGSLTTTEAARHRPLPEGTESEHDEGEDDDR